MTSSPASKKPRGRPATGIGHQVVVRMHDPMLEALDAFAADQPDFTPGRPEAVRRALAEHLKAKGYLSSDSTEATPDALPTAALADRYADADPNEAVMVTGVGPMILSRAVRKQTDWREHHGLGLVTVYRGADKRPNVFDMGDLGRLAEMARFK